MISRDDVVAKAAMLKVKLLSRADRIKNLSELITLSDVGLNPASPQRVETARSEHAQAIVDQKRDIERFATLRWVLDLTDDIDPSKLDLHL